MSVHKCSSFLFWSSSRLFFAILVVVSLLDHDSFSAEAESDNFQVTPNLPFGDINVVVLTDIHSWLGSHRRQEPYYDADLGDVLSFWERLKEHCDEYNDFAVSATTIPTKTGNDDSEPRHRDLFLVNNGDFVDGTGLSQTTDGQNNPAYLIPLLEKMPYDAMNVGNHELYSKKNIEYMTRPGGYVDWWGDRYLTSNIYKMDIATEEQTHGTGKASGDAKAPLGNRYKILHGHSSKLLAFGFLYNMRNAATGAGIEIETVQTTVTQQWFLDALTEEHYDAILVLAHMDLVDPLVDVIRLAIRDRIGDGTPIVFVTGHTHYRGVKQLEDLTMTFEAGRYMDTVGFVSFPRKDSVRSENASSLFGHTFLDANRRVLFEYTLGFTRAEDGNTIDGTDLSEFIDHTRKKLGLEKEVGCAPQSYYVERHIDAPDSLWGLYRDQVIPKIFSVRQTMIAIEEKATAEEDDLPIAMLLSKDSWRYDLYSNASLVVDDVYALAPFNDTVVHLGTFTSDVILEANKTLNKYKDGDSLLRSRALPNFILIGNLDSSSSSVTGASHSGGTPVATTKYHLYTHEFGAETIQRALKKIAPNEKVEIQKTKLTSSLIWLAFVEQYWSCDGTSGRLSNWFPKYQNMVPNLNNENGELDTKKLVVAIAVMLIWIVFRRYLVYQPVVVDDDDVVSIEENGFYKVEREVESEKLDMA